jgi:hypothetical protein
MKKIFKCIFLIVLSLLMSFSVVYSQSKEYDKLKDMVDRGKLDKAQEYCDKVTAPMSPKTASRFYALMGLAYYNNNDFPKSAEMLVKSNDKKLSLKVAKEFENKDNTFFDLKIAGALYRTAGEFEQAARLLYQEGDYIGAAEICPSPEANIKFGKQLFDEGKYDDAVLFFKKAKKKGQLFTDTAVLEYFYKKKDYSMAYSIQNSGEGSFYLPIQGTVIDKMIENNEPMPFITNFLDSIGVKGNKQFEAIINAYIINKLPEKAETYCLQQTNSNQQIALAFLAENAATSYPGTSAWANLKSGKTLLGKQQITTYLVENAVTYNSKWENEPIDKKVLEAYKKETAQMVKKCELDYCQCIGFASTMARTRNEETAKTNSAKSGEYSRAFVLLKVMEKNCK